jgi:hypothetical protein
MAKTGQPAFDSGMRGSSKPKDKASGDGKAKSGKVSRFEAEPSANGGFIHTVHHEPAGGGMEVGNYQGPEKHVHPTKEAAMDHFGTVLDAMGSSKAAKHEEGVHGGKQEHSPNVGTGDE